MRPTKRQLGYVVLTLVGLGAVATALAIWIVWSDSGRNVALLLALLMAAAAVFAAAGGYVILQLLTMRDVTAAHRELRDRARRIENRVARLANTAAATRKVTDRMHTDQLRRVTALSQHTNRMVKRVNEQQLPRAIELGAESGRLNKLVSTEVAALRTAVSPERLAAADARAMQALETLRRVTDKLISLNTENTNRVVGEMQRVGDRQADATMRASRLTSQQVGALFSIYSVLRPAAPLVPFGGWAVTPDTAAYLMRTIFDRKPSLIVEAGSGLSTTLMGLVLKAIGGGKLVTLEHDQRYHQATLDDLRHHQLEDYVELVHAPLQMRRIGDEEWSWYDLSSVEIAEPIDILVVDGPPGTSAPHARYPAVPLLWEHLASDAVVILDDAHRPAEREIVERWLAEHSGLTLRELDNDKGTAELSRRP